MLGLTNSSSRHPNPTVMRIEDHEKREDAIVKMRLHPKRLRYRGGVTHAA